MVTEFNLKTPIGYLTGVGPHRAEVLNKELNIFTFGDLLHFYPFRYVDRTIFHKINNIDPYALGVQFVGRLINYSIQGEKRSKRLIATVKDNTGLAQLVWFQGLRWIEKSLTVGQVYIIYGKPSLFNGQISISHPEVEVYKAKRAERAFQPVYSSTEKLKRLSLDSKGISKLIGVLIELLKIEESLPPEIVNKHNLVPLKTALHHIHFPKDPTTLALAKYRLKFEELFILQLKVLKTKMASSNRFAGPVFEKVGAYFNLFYKKKLPFELTNAQKRVLKEIRKDTVHGAQMNRLLQGDVGSGKTIVALMSMLLAIDNGYQACLMAPTEILAQQHYQGLKSLVGNDIAIELLTGSTKQKLRKEIYSSLEQGELQILVGTHALLEDKVQFDNLGLAIIDEQHRFGVQQRAKLWRKNTIPPHMLVMTATPIPRTLAMTLYGDLDISVIDELPAGRRPIVTVHLKEDQRLRMFGLLREEISKGRQVYVVYPLIEESEKLDLLYLEAGMEALEREFPLPTYKIGIVHGRLTPKEKESEMDRFAKGETQILVATTVIEVGVNVPNASVMVIENAERFGLSQLHQLRGRVGRGAEQSFCVLMSKDKLSKESKIRLETMVRTNDGFEIAETDLQLRGPGDIAGLQQSGIVDLKIADLTTDQQLLQMVRTEVMRIFDEDPSLEKKENVLIKTLLTQKSGGIGWEKIS
ncbi:ATP-dependent DNA helicase RecG [Albibacterium profundi]|uniref:ATP-dependent DNA helicase RecG n=1 Tax=Albibacterium profundi TaxID=3134906 RepID=A0ABV5CD72_9SPHI